MDKSRETGRTDRSDDELIFTTPSNVQYTSTTTTTTTTEKTKENVDQVVFRTTQVHYKQDYSTNKIHILRKRKRKGHKE